MALDNLISLSFSAGELAQIEEAIQIINTVLEGKVVNLTPEERVQYGSIADRNKILVDKCKAYMEQSPETVPHTIDKAEFDRDYAARQGLENPLRQLRRVLEKMQDTKTLLDHDNYQNALSYYRYVKYLANDNAPGTTSIYKDIRQHYAHSGLSAKAGASEDTTTAHAD